MAQDGKTEKPTARRLRDARKEGQFARTPDAATWLGIAAGTALVPHGVDVLRTQVGGMLATLPGVAADPTPARASPGAAGRPGGVPPAAAPSAPPAPAPAVIATAAQGGHPTTKTVKFKP